MESRFNVYLAERLRRPRSLRQTGPFLRRREHRLGACSTGVGQSVWPDWVSNSYWGALFGVFVATGNSGWRTYLTADEIARSVTFSGLCGVSVSAASVLGSWIAVAASDRAIQKSAGYRVRAAAIGAAAGTFVLGGGVSAVTTMLDGSAASAAFLMVSATALALLAGVAAAMLVAVQESRFPPRMSGERLKQSL